MLTAIKSAEVSPDNKNMSEELRPESVASRTPIESVRAGVDAGQRVQAYRAERSSGFVVVTTREGMEPYIGDWDDLAANAAEANPFYESWALLPAWKHLAGSLPVHIVMIYSGNGTPGVKESELIGLFPVVPGLRHRRFRAPMFTIWRHTHCPLCTPLVRVGFEEGALLGFFDWLRSVRSFGRLVNFELVGGDGPFYAALQSVIASRKCGQLILERFTRAVLHPLASGDIYLETVISSKRRKALAKKQLDLCEQGAVEVDDLKEADNLDQWVQQFLDLEASGWKGWQRTAIAFFPNEIAFFRELSQEAFRRERLQLLKMHLDGRPIAMQYNLVGHQGGFSVKIAYDEEYARYSPGVLLELEAIKHLHEDLPHVPWMDACVVTPTSATHDMLWNGRRVITSTFVGAGDWFARAGLALLPLVRRIYSASHRLKNRFRA